MDLFPAFYRLKPEFVAGGLSVRGTFIVLLT
jgi:hypothetical protein